MIFRVDCGNHLETLGVLVQQEINNSSLCLGRDGIEETVYAQSRFHSTRTLRSD